MTKSKRFLKTISFLTGLFYFVTQHCSYAAELHTLNALQHTSEIRLPKPPAFYIPPEWGSVEEIDGNKPPQVLLIQDAHGRYEAQKNTAAILDFLHRKRGISAPAVGTASNASRCRSLWRDGIW